jgi:hypothetical protein
MLQDLTAAELGAHQGTTFRIDYGGEAPLEAVLQEVKLHEPHPGTRPQPFSAYFRGPGRPILPQQIYKLTHDRMEPLEIFLVPVGPDPKLGGILYEAVFS